MLIRIEAFGRVLHIEYDRASQPEPPTPDESPVHLMPPMEVRSDDRHEWSRDFAGFVGRAR